MRLAMLFVGVLLGSAALAAGPRWIEVSGSVWTVQSADFPAIERALLPAVSAAAHHQGRMPDWLSYTFQYQGRRTALGRKYLYINAFCDDPAHHKLTAWVVVLDGGACFFHAKYDPDSRQVYDVVVNGIA